MLISKVYYPAEHIEHVFDTPVEDKEVWFAFREKYPILATKGYFNIQDGVMQINNLKWGRKGAEDMPSIADVLGAKDKIAAEIDWDI